MKTIAKLHKKIKLLVSKIYKTIGNILEAINNLSNSLMLPTKHDKITQNISYIKFEIRVRW